jgi:hypothetical protein
MLMQRYPGVGYPQWEDTPEPFMEELEAWIKGDALAEMERKRSGVQPGEEDIRVQARNAGLLMPPEEPPERPAGRNPRRPR